MSMDSKKFSVKSFRGFYDTDDFQEAIVEGKEMILDIITDGFDNKFWQVLVYDVENQTLIGIIECHRIGWWKISVNSKYDNVCLW